MSHLLEKIIEQAINHCKLLVDKHENNMLANDITGLNVKKTIFS